MVRQYFNSIRGYIPMFQKCVEERLWIHTNQRWYAPFDWAYKFGVSYFGMDWEPKLADPYLLISQAKSKELSEKQAGSLEKFKNRVDAYYISGKDQLLLKSIETGIWHF